MVSLLREFVNHGEFGLRSFFAGEISGRAHRVRAPRGGLHTACRARYVTKCRGKHTIPG